jgi:hypothetical protein
MHCLFCHKGPQQGVSIYRVNAKGQPGIWACKRHIGQTDAKPDPELEDIVNIISGKAKP